MKPCVGGECVEMEVEEQDLARYLGNGSGKDIYIQC